jgi:hypothetical protein
MVLDLISPKERIPLLAFGIAPDSEQLLSITLLHIFLLGGFTKHTSIPHDLT